MPNYCENSVIIYGDKYKLDSLERAMKEQEADEASNIATSDFLNTVLPVPDYLRSAESSDTFSVNDRIDWKQENWGTTYTVNLVGNRKDDHTLVLDFHSAWRPPIKAYEILVKEWKLKVRALYFEFQSGFAGIYENGNLQHYRPETLEDVSALPDDLHKVFGIKSYYKDYFDKVSANNQDFERLPSQYMNECPFNPENNALNDSEIFPF